MTESERQELKQLQVRQADLRQQFEALGRRIDAFEKGITTPEGGAIAAIPTAVAVPMGPEALPPLPSPPTPIRQPLPTAPREPQPARPLPAMPVSNFQTLPPPLPPIRPAADKAAASPRAAETSPTPKPAKKSSFEMRLGTYWLVRIGIVMVLTSLVFFGSYSYQNFVPRLGPAGKITLLYLAGGGLLAAGVLLHRRQESLRNYAQVLLAGGFAAVYFTSYAAHHIPNLQVIPSAFWDGLLLCGWAGFMIWTADRLKSEVMALLAVLLAFYASIITHTGLFTLYSNLVLTLAAVVFLVRNRWATTTFASLVATYASYAFWRFFHSGHWQWASPGEGLWTGNYFLMGYWLVFTAAAFLSRHEQFNGGRRAAFLTFNNAAFFSAFLLTMLQVHQGGFWKFSLAYGTVLTALAAFAGKLRPADKLFSNAYLTQGLLLVTLGLITYTTGLKLCLVLATESVLLLMLGRQLKSRVMQAGSMIAALLAAGWVVATLELRDPNGLATGAAVGVLMLWNVLWEQRRRTADAARGFSRTVAFFCLLGLAVWYCTTSVFTPREYLAPVLALEALVLTAAYYPTRLKEIALFGQAFLLFAQAMWLADAATAPTIHPWWNPVAVIVITLGLASWWQRQKTLVLQPQIGAVIQGIYALAAVGLLYFWLAPQFSGPLWLAFAGVLALLLTAYAAFSRYWLLAAAGQIFVLVSAWQFGAELLDGKPEWYLPLAPIAVLMLLSFCALKWFEIHPDVQKEIRKPILGIGLAYRILALGMSLCWVQQYVPVREHTWVLAALGLALFLAAGWRRSREFMIFGAVFTMAGLIKFWLPVEAAPNVYWPNAFAILGLLGQEQFARNQKEKYHLPAQIHSTAIMLGGLSLWLFLSRLILERTSGFYLTVGWSGLALTLFIAGMLLRERTYRWLGLAVLASALGHAVVFDVWKLQKVYQILSFMALGIVLLVLGFIYNRYQEKIREWL